MSHLDFCGLRLPHVDPLQDSSYPMAFTRALLFNQMGQILGKFASKLHCFMITIQRNE